MYELCTAWESPEVNTYPMEIAIGENFRDSVQWYFGFNHIRRSVLKTPEEEKTFRYFLEQRPIRHAVEIGTYKGTSTALLAHYADTVTTVDKCNFIDKFPLWIEYGVDKKIRSYMTKKNEDKGLLLATLDFDFAFVDGNHAGYAVEYDFSITEKCGRVLFHDYYSKDSEYWKQSNYEKEEDYGVYDFVNSIDYGKLEAIEPFAMWTR